MKQFKYKLETNRFYQYIFNYFIPFLLAFLLLQWIVYYPFKMNGKSFIWEIDGINQHFPVLRYYGEWLKNIIHGNGIKMMDFKVGMGFDTITTLNYYAIGDPISLLMVFVNADNAEELYRFLIEFRIFLAGISFTLYCFYMSKKGYPSVLGAMIYAFCGFVLYAGTRHPYFTNPMIYLPLLFIGLESILRKKRPYLFIIMVFISSISNFYFLYMLTIAIGIYALIRFFYTYKKDSKKSVIKELLCTVLRIGIYYGIGILLAAFIFLPVLYAFFHNGRFDSDYSVNLWHYTKGHYVKMVYSFLAPNVYSGYWTVITYAAIVPIGIMLLFRRKSYKELRFAFVLTTIFLMIPCIGYLMNGLAYVSNRWEFCYSFLIALIFVTAFDDMFRLNVIDKLLLVAGVCFYAALGTIKPNKYVWIALLFLIVSVCLIILLNHRKVQNNKRFCILMKCSIFLLVLVNIGANGFLTYDSKYGDYVDEYIDAGKVQDTIEASPVSLAPTIKDDSFYRVEIYGNKQHNEALTVGYYDVAGYFSVMDKRITEYMKGLEILNQRTAYRFDNLDYRSTLSNLAGVKYLLTSNPNIAPYGYEQVTKTKSGDLMYYMFQNQYALPLGYTYNKYILQKDYNKLNPLEKQQIMLQTVVLNDIPGMKDTNFGENLEKFEGGHNVDLNVNPIEYTYELEDGINLSGNKIKISKKGAKLKLYFTGNENSETYLRLKDFNINNSKYYYINLKVKSDNKISKTVNVRSSRHNTYFGKDEYLVNLGYHKQPISYAEITFNNKGTFHLGKIELYTVSMDDYTKHLNERSANVLTNIKIKNNKVTGTINLQQEKLLCLSIPYSNGWRAYVNGEKVDLLQANVMYMALPLEAGENHIELKYTTPLLKEGLLLSGAGCIIFLGLILWERYKRIYSKDMQR